MLALFDLDNTLIDRRAGLENWARDFAWSRVLPEGSESGICEQLRERAYPADFVHLREALGLSDDPGDLSREYVDGVARSVRCFPGVRQGLEAPCSAGWTLGIATHGAGDIQRAKLTATGLASHERDGLLADRPDPARPEARGRVRADAGGARRGHGRHCHRLPTTPGTRTRTTMSSIRCPALSRAHRDAVDPL
ncbi:HAD family hydrolase [Streptomyces candidus]|uniref:Putative hydrolase of the HAD superfamily n=1 Tax=Streptomyces candidus TaxID=67283 RepID=A0A7X0HL18_9ACTN|nr:HAD hydrolase-like protein [Streptomyces candidus]MBB6439644.1 putative hydrolase of the HAD superfamily [Streptomyces candidus]GHH56271.1 hypothetical protein GCM10018773_62020 [Streptomyces candidus]